jgi:hypothetical protein
LDGIRLKVGTTLGLSEADTLGLDDGDSLGISLGLSEADTLGADVGFRQSPLYSPGKVFSQHASSVAYKVCHDASPPQSEFWETGQSLTHFSKDQSMYHLLVPVGVSPAELASQMFKRTQESAVWQQSVMDENFAPQAWSGVFLQSSFV